MEPKKSKYTKDTVNFSNYIIIIFKIFSLSRLAHNHFYPVKNDICFEIATKKFKIQRAKYQLLMFITCYYFWKMFPKYNHITKFSHRYQHKTMNTFTRILEGLCDLIRVVSNLIHWREISLISFHKHLMLGETWA